MVSLQYVSTITICAYIWFLSSMCPLSQYVHLYGFSLVCVHYHNMRICMVSRQYVSTITICAFAWFLSSMCPLSQYAHMYGFNMHIYMVSLQYVSFVWFLSSMCHLCGGRQITTTPSPLLLLELPCPPRPTVDLSWHFITHLYMSLFQFAILCTSHRIVCVVAAK